MARLSTQLMGDRTEIAHRSCAFSCSSSPRCSSRASLLLLIALVSQLRTISRARRGVGMVHPSAPITATIASVGQFPHPFPPSHYTNILVGGVGVLNAMTRAFAAQLHLRRWIGNDAAAAADCGHAVCA